MESMYPAGPTAVPADFTAPSASYRRHAWLAMAGLFVFVAAYFGLMLWFAWTAYRMFKGIGDGEENVLGRALVAGCSVFLTVFMAKALVFVKRGDAPADHELSAQTQPELFAFLHRLADEAGAPRPHRVFLSPRVNAAVFYDLSLASLVLPSRKNLEIGLGLVNILTLGELKAVLAHEFGHFAQRTMAVGRWVYIAQQVAGHIVAKRDALDKLLQGIASIDLRVAWIGWLLQLVVWSIRSLVELLFRVVVLAQRALSREMEYQADLVAAALTGSDALVHALHRLGAADDAWGRALDFAENEARAGRPVADVFAVQAHIVACMRSVLADPHYGLSPAAATTAPELHRVFRVEMAQPPQMWATHPANADREANVKRRYLAAAIDARPATTLFRDIDALARDVSRRLFSGELPAPVPIAESLARLDADFGRRSLQRRYRGAYLGDSPFRAVDRPEELYLPLGVVSDLAGELAQMYPELLGQQLDQLRDLEQERATLHAVREGFLAAPGGIVRWRGRELRRRNLPKVIAELDAEIATLRAAIHAHEGRCRALHAEAGRRLDAGWPEYLRSLAALTHYAEHTLANVRDANGLLHNTLSIVMADGSVSAKELRRLLASCNDVQRVLADVYAQAGQVQLDERVRAAFGSDWREALGEFGLMPATDANINSWMQHIDGWVGHTCGALSALRRCALETLLAAEEELATALQQGQAELAAPAAGAVPGNFARLLPGKERKRQTKLGWMDRFQTADGTVATACRLLVAGSIIGAALWVSATIDGGSPVTVYNGLAVPVQVELHGSVVDVPPGGHASVDVPTRGDLEVVARLADGTEIERFDVALETGPKVYNVAGAATMVQWTASYGRVAEIPPQELGAPRWSVQHVEYLFTEPPEQISSKGDGGHRTALMAMGDGGPGRMLPTVRSGDEQAAMIRAHARWDAIGSPHLVEWLWAASELPGYDELLLQRLAARPEDVMLRRLRQDTGSDAGRDQACVDDVQRAGAAAGDGNRAYLAARCARGDAQDAAFLAAHQRWPDNPWLQLAVGYVQAERQQWDEARTQLAAASSALGAAAPHLAVELARLHRVRPDGGAELEALAATSEDVAMLVAIENGTGTAGTPMEGYTALARGALDKAVADVRVGDPAGVDRMVRLAAASDGATPALVRQALALPAASGVDPSTVWTALALAEREHDASASELRRAALASDEEDGAAVLAFADALRDGRRPDEAEQHLGSVSPRARGNAYAMAAVLLGTRCPAAWREQARRLLFAQERPFLG